jgi:hypothetical protein
MSPVTAVGSSLASWQCIEASCIPLMALNKSSIIDAFAFASKKREKQVEVLAWMDDSTHWMTKRPFVCYNTGPYPPLCAAQ